MIAKRRMSVAEYLALPPCKPYLEYIDGEVVAKVSPRRKHWMLATVVAHELFEFTEANGGSTGTEPHVRFATARGAQYRVPDVACWAPGKPEGDDEITLPPTLAVEIRSPDESMASQRAKCRFYRAHGVDACWLIDPEARTAETFEGEGDAVPVPSGGALTSAFLLGFALPLAELFAALDR